MNSENKSALDLITKEVLSSSIPIEKPIEENTKTLINPDLVNRENWGALSNELLSDYDYGKSYALFGNNELNLNKFFQRLANAICTVIINEYQKRGESTEELITHFNMIKSIFELTAKDVLRNSPRNWRRYPELSPPLRWWE